jgi:hypothetical protein
VLLAPLEESIVFIRSVIAMICTTGTASVTHAFDVVGKAHLCSTGVVGDPVGWSSLAEYITDAQSQIDEGLKDWVKWRGLALQSAMALGASSRTRPSR